MECTTDIKVSVVAVLNGAEDRAALRSIFNRSNWKLRLVETLRETETEIQNSATSIVISDSTLFNGYCWKDILKLAQETLNAPKLIVASDQIDSPLWSEVLNYGGHDVLVKPFEADKVFHVVALAWLAWQQNTEYPLEV